MKIFKKYSYWFIYTIAFISMFGLVFIYFFLSNHTMINYIDSLNQQYSSLLYFHRWGREILDTWLNTGKLQVPIFDVNIGFGNDIITTVFYYLSASPITFGAIFCPESYLEYFYMLEIIFRLYLVGVGFSVYARSHRLENWSVLLGSLCYCFCGFVLQKGIQHTFFILPMFFLPMILYGADKILKGKSPFLFIFFLAWCATNNFYFFYMIVIAVILYVFCQLLFSDIYTWKTRAAFLFKFAGYGITSVLLAGFSLLPILYAMTGSSRIGNDKFISFLYDASYYFNLFWGCGTNTFRQYDARTGYSVSIILCVFLLLCKKGEKKLKIALAGLTILLCIPLAGSIMNGMGYVSNRWIFIYSFLLSYILSKMAPEFGRLNSNLINKISLILLVYLALGIMIPLFKGISTDGEIYRSGMCLVILYMGIIGILNYLPEHQNYLKLWIAFLTIFSILLNSQIEFSPEYGNMFSAYVRRGDALSIYTDNLPSNYLLNLSDRDIYRSSVNSNGEKSNSFMLQKLHGTEYYFSVVNGDLNEFMHEMYYNNCLEAFYNGWDNQMILDSLTGVKYNLVDNEMKSGHSPAMEMINEFGPYQLWQNNSALPIVYCYQNYISTEKYNLMDVTDKQEALLQGAIVENSKLNETKPIFFNRAISFTTENTNEVEQEKNTFKVLCSGGKIKLKLEEIPCNSEVHVIFKDISFEGLNPLETRDNWQEVEWVEKYLAKKAAAEYEEPNSVSIKVEMGDISNNITYITPKHRYYCGKNDFVCNLGYIENGTNEVILTFEEEGIYDFSDIEIVELPMKQTIERLSALQSNDIPSWNWGCNTMYGNIDCSQDEILCITVPYSIGWKAFVDGEEREIKKVNTAFMGLELSKGRHSIKLVYELPFGKFGAIMSALGIVIFSIILIYQKIKKVHKK